MTNELYQWLPTVSRSGKPVYLEIADAIAADIESGRLQPNDRLPPQRWLADRLDLNFGTVSRAYVEAQRRGLIESQVGRGSFVRPQPMAGGRAVPARGSGDMSMNLPPEPEEGPLLDRLRASFGRLAQARDPRSLLRYQDFAGDVDDRQAGARWLADRLPGVTAESLVVCPGAQGGLLATLTLLARPGDRVCCEALTYPGFRALAAHLGLVPAGLPMDDDGIEPAAFDAACRDRLPRALYLTPTLHNPTTLVMSERRRLALLEVARRHGVPIVEDDAYGLLPDDAPPSMAALAPDIVFHVAGLSKCLGAGLRLAYLRAPDSRSQGELVAALRATSLMASPLTAGLASLWINDGTGAALLDFVRRESRARQDIAAAVLPAGSYRSQPNAFHLWLPLPARWRQVEFVLHLKDRGVGAVASDYFAASAAAPEGIRLSIGGRLDRAEVRDALKIVAAALDGSPTMVPAVV